MQRREVWLTWMQMWPVQMSTAVVVSSKVSTTLVTYADVSTITGQEEGVAQGNPKLDCQYDALGTVLKQRSSWYNRGCSGLVEEPKAVESMPIISSNFGKHKDVKSGHNLRIELQKCCIVMGNPKLDFQYTAQNKDLHGLIRDGGWVWFNSKPRAVEFVPIISFNFGKNKDVKSGPNLRIELQEMLYSHGTKFSRYSDIRQAS
ncbi:hypothetical protein NC652_038885 [Populus alba x Populus x berolinensis]|nr:hypothetical protein NC652_038885 [Populus alba x Populus x berolinensis]